MGLGLALGASLGWGVADFLGGLQARRVALLRVMVISQGPALLALLVIVAAFYRALAIGKMSIVAPIAATGVSIPVIVGIATGDDPRLR